MADRIKIPVYRIEHDDNSGRLDVRASFTRHPEAITRTLHEPTGLVMTDTMDGGLEGYITAPAGSRVAECQDGGLVLVLPGHAGGLDPDEAISAARHADRRQSYGLVWVKATETED